MADKNLKLVVTADTTDARKKVEDVGKTKVEPINVQTKFDETGVGKFVKTINGMREVVNRVFSALGMVGFIAGTVMAAVAAYNNLKAKLEEVRTAAAKLKFKGEMQSAASETSRLCSVHERLSRLLKEELDTLAKQKSVRAIREEGERDLEDGKRAADRARKIYEAATPEEEQALRDQFAAEDEQIERDRRRKTRDTQIRDLDEEESSYTSKAKGLRQNNADIDRQIKDEELNVRRARGSRKDGEEIGENEKAAAARLKALKERKAANEAEIAQYEKEAAFRREQIAALESQKDYDGPSAGEWERKTEAKKREEEDFEEKKRKARESDDNAREFVEAQRAEEERDRNERIGALQSDSERAASVDAVSQNRLTAMGLGSGVAASGGVQTEMHRIIDILREQVRATKDIKPVEIDTTAHYAE